MIFLKMLMKLIILNNLVKLVYEEKIKIKKGKYYDGINVEFDNNYLLYNKKYINWNDKEGFYLNHDKNNESIYAKEYFKVYNLRTQKDILSYKKELIIVNIVSENILNLITYDNKDIIYANYIQFLDYNIKILHDEDNNLFVKTGNYIDGCRISISSNKSVIINCSELFFINNKINIGNIFANKPSIKIEEIEYKVYVLKSNNKYIKIKNDSFEECDINSSSKLILQI